MNVNEDKINSMIDTYRNYYENLKDEIALCPFYPPSLIPTGSIPPCPGFKVDTHTENQSSKPDFKTAISEHDSDF